MYPCSHSFYGQLHNPAGVSRYSLVFETHPSTYYLIDGIAPMNTLLNNQYSYCYQVRGDQTRLGSDRSRVRLSVSLKKLYYQAQR